jgi:hypothetical protein
MFLDFFVYFFLVPRYQEKTLCFQGRLVSIQCNNIVDGIYAVADTYNVEIYLFLRALWVGYTGFYIRHFKHPRILVMEGFLKSVSCG